MAQVNIRIDDNLKEKWYQQLKSRNAQYLRHV